jgi:cell division protein FtsI/penicillin-binding protein 2
MKHWRINLVFIFIILFGAAIISRLVYLQILQHDFYKALAQGQQKDFQSLKGERGKIFFRGGQVLATNIEGKYLFVSPQEIEEKEETARVISQTLGIEEELVLEKINKDNFYEQIKSNLTKEEEDSLKKINLPGVYLGQASFRKYPQEFMASQTIGFLGGEEKGQYGLEGYYDDMLQGEECFQEGEGGPGEHFSSGISGSADKGDDIFLTLDYNIQFMAEKLLNGAKENLAIEGGQIIVLEPNSGKILALANFPNFNPNNYSEVEDFQVFQNPTTQKLFEPGSVFKPITMAGALDQEKITPQTIYIDPGRIQIGAYTITNYDERTYGQQTMTGVLERSINTGAVFVERQLGHNNFLEYIKRFGFFEPTGIDLQEEIFSENKEFKKGYEINFVTASFGQGIEITPIQLARAFCAIANGGKLVRPYLAERISENGKTTEIKPEIFENRVISQRTASQLTAMLVSVVENGFGKAAKVPGYYIAGKTGTAQVPWSALGINKKGYSGKTWQSFVGFAPAFNARFLILVKLDNPKARTAEYSAIPIFQELAKYIIDYLQIPPDYEPS